MLLALLFEKTKSELVWTENFTTEEYLTMTSSGSAELVNFKGKNALKVTCDTANQYASSGVYYTKNFSFSGKGIRFSCDIFAENVSVPSYNYLGIKFMYPYNKNGETLYPQQNDIKWGSTDNWVRGQFDIISDVDDEITSGRLVLGLQGSTGTVYFSNMTVEIFDAPNINYSIPENFKCEYTDKVTKRNRARGAMSPTSYVEEDFEEFKRWNGNFFRWQINNYKGDETNLTQFNEWIDFKIEELESVLKKAEELKIWIVIDLHTPPGGRDNSAVPYMYQNQTYLDAFYDIWERIATRFKGRRMVWGYDLLNEPVVGNMIIHYLQVQYNTIMKIRAIDPDTPIIVESDEYDSVKSYCSLRPMPFKDIIYQIHYYKPSQYTHQGVGSVEFINASYPGVINTQMWNSTVMDEDFKCIKEFQKKYDARVYLGEFSAVRWAPGAEVYINDVIDIAEENGWDWTYHAYREWSGWSVEYDTNKSSTTPVNDTLRKQVLLKYYARNGEFTDDTNDDNSTTTTTDIYNSNTTIPPENNNENKGNSKTRIIAVSCSIIAIVAVAVGAYFIIKKNNKHTDDPSMAEKMMYLV